MHYSFQFGLCFNYLIHKLKVITVHKSYTLLYTFLFLRRIRRINITQVHYSLAIGFRWLLKNHIYIYSFIKHD